MKIAIYIFTIVGAASVLREFWRNLPRLGRNMDGGLLVTWRNRRWLRDRYSGNWKPV